jgi:hypothetical protein
MKVIVRNPSLPLLVGSILLDISIHKSARLRGQRLLLPDIEPVETPLPSAGWLGRFRQAWALRKQRHRETMGLGQEL